MKKHKKFIRGFLMILAISLTMGCEEIFPPDTRSVHMHINESGHDLRIKSFYEGRLIRNSSIDSAGITMSGFLGDDIIYPSMMMDSAVFIFDDGKQLVYGAQAPSRTRKNFLLDKDYEYKVFENKDGEEEHRFIYTFTEEHYEKAE